MSKLDIAQRYFDAWNAHDPAAISASFAEGGFYSDPTAGKLPGTAVGNYAAGLYAGFPDLSFDVQSTSETDDGRLVAQWIMKGTNAGSFGGGPPTDRSVALPGVDVIAFEGDRVRSVEGYFDQRTLVDQLGLQVIVQPHEIGPFKFGYSVRAHAGNTAEPGAFSLTWIQVRSPEEEAKVVEYSRQIATEMIEMPGFITWTAMVVGNRMYTVTAWEDAENARRLMRDGTHRKAVQHFFNNDFAVTAQTGVWEKHHLNTLWVHCSGCGKKVNFDEGNGVCICGASLGERPAAW